VLESGMLTEGDGRWDLAQPLDTLDIPMTLRDSLMARLDRLNTAKRVAQLASVIGRTFTFRLLAAVADVDEPTLVDGLKRLADAELLFQRGEPPAATYTFKHAMIQETAYGSLLIRRRRELHSRVAGLLAHDLRDERDALPEIIARHHEAAGETELAVVAYRLAADVAAKHSGFKESLDLVQHAIDLLGTLRDSEQRRSQELDLQIALGSTIITLHGYSDPRVETIYERARLLAEVLGDERRLAEALIGVAIFFLNEGQIVRGGDLSRRALDLAERLDDDELRILALVHLSIAQYYTGEFAGCLASTERAWQLYDRDRHHAVAYRLGTDMGVVAGCFGAVALWHVGRPDASLAWVREAQALAEHQGRPFDRAYALHFIAMNYWGRGDFAEMIAHGQATIAISEEQAFDWWLSLGRLTSLAGRIFCSRDASLIPELLAAAAVAASNGRRGGVPSTASMVAHAMLDAGAHDQAAALLAIARDVADQTGQQYWSSELERMEGDLLLATGGAPATIEAKFRKALALAEQQGSIATALRAAVSLTAFLRGRGADTAEAMTALRALRSRIEGGERTSDVRLADALLGQVAGKPSVG
jgi:tetratricopeptide (TPR) repeat protein